MSPVPASTIDGRTSAGSLVQATGPVDAPSLIVVAHAAGPGPGGPEAEVNGALLDALVEHWPACLTVITAGRWTPGPTGGRATVRVRQLGEHGTNGRPPLASRVAAWSAERLRSDGPSSVPARVVNRSIYWTTGGGSRLMAWASAAARALGEELAREPAAVVYSRALPYASIDAVARVRRRRTFRWVVNINDPLPPDIAPAVYQTTVWTNRRMRAALTGVIPLVDAFTFPCEGIRALQVGAFPAIGSRPSVILPHIAKPIRVSRSDSRADDRRLRVVFCGTLRKADSRPELAEGLRRLVDEGHAVRQEVQFTFLLRDANPYAEALIRSLPIDTRIEVGVGHDRVDRALAEADVLLDLEAESYGALLLTKLARYIGGSKPIWAICPVGGTTWKLVTGHGCGYATALGDARGVTDTLRRIHADWRAGTLAANAPGETVRRRFSAARQIDDLRALCGVLETTSGVPVGSGTDWP